jgi:tyrosine-protein kinase Etk/Wzc
MQPNQNTIPLHDIERVAQLGTEQTEISPLDVLIILASRKRTIMSVAFWIALLSIIISLLLPFRYTAITSVLPPQQNSSAGTAMMAGSLNSLPSLGILGLKNPNDLQVALLKSRTVEDAMVDRFRLKDVFHVKRRSDARKRLESITKIDGTSKDGLIRIAITDKDPQHAADLANGYVEEFQKFSATLALSEASQRRIFFEKQLNQAKDSLAKAEEELKRTEQTTGLSQLDSQARSTIELIAQLRAQIAAKETQISAMKIYATQENPDLQIAEQELTGLRAQATKVGATSESATNALIPKGSLQQSSLEYVRKLRDVRYFETIFNLLARQYEVAKVDEAKQGAIVQVVDAAVVPDRRSFPQRTLIVLAATLLGFIIGVAYAILKESIERMASDPVKRSRLEFLRSALSIRSKNSHS